MYTELTYLYSSAGASRDVCQGNSVKGSAFAVSLLLQAVCLSTVIISVASHSLKGGPSSQCAARGSNYVILMKAESCQLLGSTRRVPCRIPKARDSASCCGFIADSRLLSGCLQRLWWWRRLQDMAPAARWEPIRQAPMLAEAHGRHLSWVFYKVQCWNETWVHQ